MARTLLGPKPTPAPISEKAGADSKRCGITILGSVWWRIPSKRERPLMPPPIMAMRRGLGAVWPFVCGGDMMIYGLGGYLGNFRTLSIRFCMHSIPEWERIVISWLEVLVFSSSLSGVRPARQGVSIKKAGNDISSLCYVQVLSDGDVERTQRAPVIVPREQDSCNNGRSSSHSHVSSLPHAPLKLKSLLTLSLSGFLKNLNSAWRAPDPSKC